MRITAAQKSQNENRIRAAIDRLLRGDIPPGGACDITTLAREAGVDRAAFYGNRPYTHLRAEFERRLQQHIDTGDSPDPREAQITRLKTEVDKLKQRLAASEATVQALNDFRSHALARLAAQHDEITQLRAALAGTATVTPISTARTVMVGPCN